MAGETRGMHGEVSEREDLLDGRVRVDLDGEAGGWQVAAAFAWRRGRGAESELDRADSFFTAVDGERELHASVRSGSVEVDPDTGVATVRAVLVVDEAEGGLAAAGDRLAVRCAVGAKTWSGELRAGG